MPIKMDDRSKNPGVCNCMYCLGQVASYIRKTKTEASNDFLKLGGQVVMRHAAVAAAAILLFCQNLGGQLLTLHTRH
jgi:hypothetical protein